MLGSNAVCYVMGDMYLDFRAEELSLKAQVEAVRTL